MKRITQYWISITLVVLLVLASAAYAQDGFTLSRSTVDDGGGTLDSSGFTLTGAIGQPDAGFPLDSGDLTLVGGVFAGPGQLPAAATAVGGYVAPVNRLELLAPWLGLAALAGLVLAGAVALARKRVG